MDNAVAWPGGGCVYGGSGGSSYTPSCYGEYEPTSKLCIECANKTWCISHTYSKIRGKKFLPSGKLMYKCKKCGVVFAGGFQSQLKDALNGFITEQREQNLEFGYMTVIHDCGSGSIGIADLIGGKYEVE